MTDYRSLIGGALEAPEVEGAPRVAFFEPVGATPSEANVVIPRAQYQRQASSCLPHAFAFVLESEFKSRTGAGVEVSIMDAYYGYRVLAKDFPKDIGSYPHHAQTWHAQHGALPDTLATYDAAKVTTWKPSAQHASLRPGWTAIFERMAQEPAQIEAEIAAGRAVVVCHRVFDQMVDVAGRTGEETFSPSWESRGGHGRAVVSYNKARARFGLWNWWLGWGVKCPWDGRFKDSFSEVPYEVLLDPRWAWDFRRLVRGLEVLS